MNETIDEYTNIPVITTITRNTNTNKVTIHIRKFGNKYKGFSIELTEEQTEKIKWWY